MPPDPASAVAIKIGMEIFTRVTPRGFAWVKSKWVGRDLLVVGQARAGKTSLVRYIQYGVFAERETSPKSWEERSIRHEYHLRYSPEERVLGVIQNFEPLFWMIAVFSCTFPKLGG